MTIANGTDAQEVCRYFVNKTGGKTTSKTFQKYITIAKSLLKGGYTVEDITSVIDYIIDIKKIDMYSLGFLSSTMDKYHRELSIFIASNEMKESMQQASPISEVLTSDSSSRNQSKLNRFGTQSRFREKSHLNLFEERGQDH